MCVIPQFVFALLQLKCCCQRWLLQLLSRQWTEEREEEDERGDGPMSSQLVALETELCVCVEGGEIYICLGMLMNFFTYE